MMVSLINAIPVAPIIDKVEPVPAPEPPKKVKPKPVLKQVVKPVLDAIQPVMNEVPVANPVAESSVADNAPTPVAETVVAKAP